jgi:hypothetical protein
MVEPDSFDALTTRFQTAGLLRRGERLCRDAHAVSIPRNEAGDDDDEADEEEEYYVCDDYDSPWDPIPVERVRSEETRDALGPFQCRGACPGDQDQDGRSSPRGARAASRGHHHGDALRPRAFADDGVFPM